MKMTCVVYFCFWRNELLQKRNGNVWRNNSGKIWRVDIRTSTRKSKHIRGLCVWVSSMSLEKTFLRILYVAAFWQLIILIYANETDAITVVYTDKLFSNYHLLIIMYWRAGLFISLVDGIGTCMWMSRGFDELNQLQFRCHCRRSRSILCCLKLVYWYTLRRNLIPWIIFCCSPFQKAPVSLNRYDDEADNYHTSCCSNRTASTSSRVRGKARALYTFRAQSRRELSFRKGDYLYLLRQIDKNWFYGERHGLRGIFPINYVEVCIALRRILGGLRHVLGGLRCVLLRTFYIPKNLRQHLFCYVVSVQNLFHGNVSVRNFEIK